MTSKPYNEYSSEVLPAIRYVSSPKSLQLLAIILLALFGVFFFLLVFLPWQQNIITTGRVVAYAPIERQQSINMPVDGRVVRWHAVEGAQVKKGDLIVEIADNDPEFLTRLKQQRNAAEETLKAAQTRVRNLEDRVHNLKETRETSILAAKSRIQAALDRVRASEQSLASAEATLFAAEKNMERQKKLNEKGLSSDRTFELAIAEHNRSLAELQRAKNNIDVSKGEHEAAVAELNRTDADARTRIDEALAAKASAESDVAKAVSELSKAETLYARQAAQMITAPIDGIIHRVDSMQIGGYIKGGEPLATLLPVSSNLVVELFVGGHDIPLVTKGRKARIQFEGWPAVQIIGWPCMAIGTFGGEVINVDLTENGEGKFRILVAPDREDIPWPSSPFLRQGNRANGWVLLDRVPLWYELWRKFNGFSPLAGSKNLANEVKKMKKK